MLVSKHKRVLIAQRPRKTILMAATASKPYV
jgi:hypothetical protein